MPANCYFLGLLGSSAPLGSILARGKYKMIWNVIFVVFSFLFFWCSNIFCYFLLLRFLIYSFSFTQSNVYCNKQINYQDINLAPNSISPITELSGSDCEKI